MSAQKWNIDRITRAVISLAVVAILYLLIRRLSGVLLPFLVSMVIAYMLNPLVDFLQHKCRLKNRVLSVIAALLLTAGVLTGAVAALAAPISKQVKSVSVEITEYVQNFNPHEFISPELNERLRELMQNIDLQKLLDSGELQQTVKNVLPTMGSWIGSGLSALAGLTIVFVCLLYIIFLLIDFETIEKNWKRFIPEKYKEGVLMLVSDLATNMNAYFRGQALIASIVGILFAIGFQIIGLPLGIVMGIIIGILNLIPYMQALGIPVCVLLGLLQSYETGRPIWVVMLCIAAVFIIVQSIQDMVLTPKIMGNVTGMGPAWILLALSIWGSLLGIVGMIIALPLTSLLISYYKRFVLKDNSDSSEAAPTDAAAAEAAAVAAPETDTPITTEN